MSRETRVVWRRTKVGSTWRIGCSMGGIWREDQFTTERASDFRGWSGRAGNDGRGADWLDDQFPADDRSADCPSGEIAQIPSRVQSDRGVLILGDNSGEEGLSKEVGDQRRWEELFTRLLQRTQLS